MDHLTSLEPTSSAGPAISGTAPVTARQGWFAIFALNLLFICSYIDRQVIAYMVEPMQKDLSLTDTQIGMLMGPAFGLFYAVMGMPLGVLADRMSRKKLVAMGAAAWSVLTAGCGIASGYISLFLLRFGVGVGEASLGPSAYSMVADYFDKSVLARATSVLSTGIVIGGGLSSIIGSSIVAMSVSIGTVSLPIVGEIRPWQMVFLIVGTPGLALAALMLTVREPPRRHLGKQGSETALLTQLKTHGRAYTCHILGFAMLMLCANASVSWLPTQLIRNRGMDIQTIGLLLGISISVMGCLGMLLFGFLSDWLSRRGKIDGALLIGAVMALTFLSAILLTVWSTSFTLIAIGIFAMGLFTGSWNGVALASLQLITPSHLRGRMSAFYLLIANFVGLVFGAPSVALLTDHVFKSPSAVGTSIALAAATSVLFGVGFFLLGRSAYREAWHAQVD